MVKHVDLSVSLGVAVREYQTDIGPADYVLFVDRKPVGIIEAKREEEAHHLTQVEEQSYTYARSKLKYCCRRIMCGKRIPSLKP